MERSSEWEVGYNFDNYPEYRTQQVLEPPSCSINTPEEIPVPQTLPQIYMYNHGNYECSFPPLSIFSKDGADHVL